MKLSHDEKLVQQIAVLLLTKCQLNPHEPHRSFEIIANEAIDLAIRASYSYTDPTWATIPGRPHYNVRLHKLLEAVAGKCVLKVKIGKDI